jgi:hypothetical protein
VLHRSERGSHRKPRDQEQKVRQVRVAAKAEIEELHRQDLREEEVLGRIPSPPGSDKNPRERLLEYHKSRSGRRSLCREDSRRRDCSLGSAQVPCGHQSRLGNQLHDRVH